jgi:hypothetical protein
MEDGLHPIVVVQKCPKMSKEGMQKATTRRTKKEQAVDKKVLTGYVGSREERGKGIERLEPLAVELPLAVQIPANGDPCFPSPSVNRRKH